MKKNVFFLFFALTPFFTNAQDAVKKDTTANEYNKLTIELSTGQSKGLKPFTNGYFSSNDKKVFGSISLNSYNFGARYMFSPIFGLKADVGYLDLKNNKNTISLPFEMKVYTLGIQGVVNASRLFNLENPGRFGLLLHGGIQISQMNSNTANEVNSTNPADVIRYHNSGLKEYNGGIIFGFSPQFRLCNRISLISDISIVSNYRQHFAWDGAYSDASNNLSGELVSMSLGLTYSIGNNKMHGDWSIIKDKYQKQIDSLKNKVEEIETLMNDTDRDGVADYLDQENNSINGVAVDTRGKMVDLNGNGVPDELEKYIDQKIQKNSINNNSNNQNVIKQLINEGYISAFFETNQSSPTDISSPGIDYIRVYLKNNPKETVDILGHADEVGSSESNIALSKARALAIKDILIKAGIDGSRLNIVSKGEDNSVEEDSEGARKLVRKVTFKIK